MILKEGSVAEIYCNKKITAAYCFELKNSSAKFLLENGKTVKMPADKVLFVSDSAVTDMNDSSALSAYLGRLSAERDRIASEIPLRDIWELCCDDMISLGIKEIADLWYGDSYSDNDFAGLQRAVMEDSLFFRRKNDLFFINPPDKVYEIEHMRELENVRKERLNAFSAAAALVLSGKASSIPEGFSDFISVLSDAAARPSSEEPSRQAADLCERIGIKTSGIFDFLVKASVFDENENLLLKEYGITVGFPKEAEDECIAFADSLTEDGYEDFTFLNVVTIDDAKTTDIDDGISLDRLDDGLIRVGVHITDASSIIRLGTAADEEAFKRGTSIYMPDIRIHMLPQGISEERGSLAEGRRRRAMSFFFEFEQNDDGFDLKNFSIKKTIVRSKARLTYDDADRLIAEGGDLAELYKIASSSLSKRKALGALTLSRKRVSVSVRDGIPFLELDDSSRPSAVLVSEFMILSNTHVAEFCFENSIPCFYRNQPAPSYSQAEKDEIDIDTELGLYKVRRYLKKVYTSSEPSGHFSIGCRCYVQSTSPLRRYMDLAIHRQIKSFIETGKPLYSNEDIENIITMTSGARSAAESMEKLRKRYWMLKYIQMNRNELRKAMVLKAGPDRLIARDMETLIESEIQGDPLKYYEGQIITIAVAHVSPKENTLRFTAVEPRG